MKVSQMGWNEYPVWKKGEMTMENVVENLRFSLCIHGADDTERRAADYIRTKPRMLGVTMSQYVARCIVTAEEGALYTITDENLKKRLEELTDENLRKRVDEMISESLKAIKAEVRKEQYDYPDADYEEELPFG